MIKFDALEKKAGNIKDYDDFQFFVSDLVDQVGRNYGHYSKISVASFFDQLEHETPDFDPDKDSPFALFAQILLSTLLSAD